MGMFSKEPKPKTTMPKSQVQGASILSIAVYTMLAVAVVLICATLAYSWLDSERQDKAAKMIASHSSTDLAVQMGFQLKEELNTIKRFSRSKLLAAKIEVSDQAQIKTLQASLVSQLMLVDQVLLLTSEQIEQLRMQGQNNPYKLSFAGIGMVANAAKFGASQPFEIHQINRPNMHMAVAVPIAKDGQVVGVTFATLPLSHFEQLVNRVSQYGSDLVIQQVAGLKPVTILASNPSAKHNQKDAVVAAVSNSILQIAAWPVITDSNRTPLEVSFLVFSVAAVLIGIIIWVFASYINNLMKKDLGRVMTVVESMAEGEPIRKGVVKLKAFHGTLSMLEMLTIKQTSVDTDTKVADHDNDDHDPVRSFGTQDHDILVEESSESLDRLSVINPAVVGQYDIRGLVDVNLSADDYFALGMAIGSETYDRGQQTVVVARDRRSSSEAMSIALVQGLRASGRDVVDIGETPSPVLYFATHFLASDCGVMVTASHRADSYNGLKIILSGEVVYGEALKSLVSRLENKRVVEGAGGYSEQVLIPDYTARIAEDVQLAKPLKVVVDCGGGISAAVAPGLLQLLGCEVIGIRCDKGESDESETNPADPGYLMRLSEQVQAKGADIGFAFDGDGDRLGVVDSSGNNISIDRLLMFLAQDVVSCNPGSDIIYDVKSSRNLASHILAAGGRPIMWKSGYPIMRDKMIESDALVGAEYNGHIFFRDRWYGFEDAIYASIRVLEMIAMDGRNSTDIFSELPDSPASPEYIVPVGDADPLQLMVLLQEKAQFPGAKLITIDGIRAEFKEGWGLIRASNSEVGLSFRFESDSEAGLGKMKDVFRHFVNQQLPEIQLPF